MSKDMSFWLVIIGMFCAGVIPLLMFIGTWLYVNKTPRKQRLIELGYGTNNDWYRGKWIDFVDANYIISLMPGVAYAMRFRKGILGKDIPDMTLTNKQEYDNNYNKLIYELKFFIRWELIKYFLIFFGITILLIGISLNKG